MAPAFDVVKATKADTLKNALKAAKVTVAHGDVVCYELAKKDSVSAKHEVALVKGKTLLRGGEALEKLGLDAGAKKLKLSPDGVPAGYTCFVQSTSHNRKVPKDTRLLRMPAAADGAPAKAMKGSVKRKPSAASGSPAAKRGSGAAGADVTKRIAKIKELFLRFGELEKSPSKKVPESACAEVQQMMKVAAEWHVRKDHCGVFGLNFFDKKTGFLDKVMIMGDEDMVEDWKKDNKSPNCGEDDWECFACCSEFDYFFVNSAGATRRIVNNCCEDKPFTKAPFTNFMDKVESFAKKYVAFREKYGDDWEDEEPPQF